MPTNKASYGSGSMGEKGKSGPKMGVTGTETNVKAKKVDMVKEGKMRTDLPPAKSGAPAA